MKKVKQKIYNLWNNQNTFVMLIVFFSLSLRLIGITHSFPQITHPDEPTVIRTALGVRFNPNPEHFDWPHLFVYLNYFLYMGFAFVRNTLELFGLKGILSSIFPLIWNDDLVFYLLTRVFSIVLGSLTVIPVYLAAKKLFSIQVARLSALTFAILPFHIWHSQYSLIDVPMTFFLAWALYFSINIYKRGLLKDYMLAGLFVGFAASTKYNGVFSSLSVVIAHFLSVRYSSIASKLLPKNFKNLIIAGITSLVGFVIGTPFSVLDYETFSRTDSAKGAYWQFTNVGDASLITQISKFFSLFATKLQDDFGFTVMYVYLGVVIVLFASFFLKSKIDIKNKRDLLMLVIPSLYFFFYIAGVDKSRSHYYFITYPYVAIVSSYGAYEIKRFLTRTKREHLIVPLLILYIVLPLLVVTKNSIKRIKSTNTYQLDKTERIFNANY